MGIIIFGASGAGSTTLGKEIAERLSYQYLDIDDYLWRWDTEIPLTATRPSEERTKGLMSDIKKYPDFVISGTIFNDRKLFHPLLDLAVFISTPAEVCAERVRIREYARWGKRVLPGGDMYKITRFHGDVNDYIANAQKYETAEVSKFGRKLHEQWITELPCPVIRMDGTKSISENANWVIEQFSNLR
ncbi:MAG: shikimate kinase [Firmicutes bacterium]|nr:shikimate kinase [Bacillota bacterium]